MLPPDQLQQFAGARRLYYALATYGSPRGDDARFSIHPETLDRTPCITLAADFTGRTLHRARSGKPAASAGRYGAPASPPLTWGGDDALQAAAARTTIGDPNAYDDGFDPGLWEKAEISRSLDDATFDPAVAGDLEDDYDAPDEDMLGSTDAYGSADGGGYEDAPAAMAQGAAVQVIQRPGAALHDRARHEHHDHHDEDDHEDHDHRRPHGYAHGRAPSARAFGYSEEPPAEPDLPPRGAPSARDLTIPTKLHIVEVVAAAETGATGPLGDADLPQYSAFNPDTEFHDPASSAYHRQHIGLSFGLIQFTQRSGALGKVLAVYHDADPSEFAQVFGPSADDLLRVTNAASPEARLAPVEGRVLWDPVWTARFVEAGKRQACRTAQRRVAVEAFMDPHLRVAGWLGLDSERALAMLYDRCVHQGNGAGLAWVVRASGPIQTQLAREEALRALGFDHLGAFQATVPYLDPSDGWGPETHAAMAMRLRALGPSSPVPVPTLPEMLDRLVAASRGTDAFPRLQRLRTTTELSDAPLLLPEG